MVTKSAVIGIDLGANESYVSYVGKGIVDIVQNEVSKRATPTIVGFTDRERVLGDAALSLIRSNAKNTCRNFKHLLGRQFSAEDVAKEHFWSTSSLCETDDGFSGYSVSYKSEARQMSATQVTAMYLTKLKEITEKWCQAKVADAVIAVPASFSDVQRQALLDAAKIANLSVLRVMNEHTATALAYGIYRTNDFDADKPLTVAFASMGHSIFSVSIVQFVKGRLCVLCEKSDKVGGRDMDECLMREFAAQFKKKMGCDPLSNKKAAFKLEDAVTKTKKILSANNEANVSVECLMEDEDFASTITRADFEKMCGPMMDKVKAVLNAAIDASQLTVEEIDSVEIVGGASRVPWVKNMISEAFGGKSLSTTMNQDESVARGCALQAAILSPLFKVRDFKVEDSSPFGVSIGWVGSAADAEASKEDDGDTQMGGAEGEQKTSVVFPAGSAMNSTKMLTFYRKAPFDIKAQFVEDAALPRGTKRDLGNFKVELPGQPAVKKVKVKAKITLHGTFAIEGAQMVEEEEYEEVVKEKRELPPEEPEEEVPEEAEEANGKEPNGNEADAEPAAPDGKEADAEKNDGEAATNGTAAQADAKQEKEVDDEDNADKAEEQPKAPEKKRKEPETRYEWVDVVKKKRRTKRTEVTVTATNRPGLAVDIVQKRMDEETMMIADTQDIIETDEKRNDLEAYIFNMRSKVSESGEYGPYIKSSDRDKFMTDLQTMEDWLYDTYDATKLQYIDKLDELKVLGDPVVWRFKEASMRPDWVEAVTGTVKNYRDAGENPGDKYGHIAPEKLAKIVAACTELEKWLDAQRALQDAAPKFEKPVLMCAEMEKRNQELAKMADEILKEPKPAPPKEEKKEEQQEDADAGDASASPKEEDADSNEEGEGADATAQPAAADGATAASNDMDVD